MDIYLNYILKFAEVLQCSPAYLVSEEPGLDADLVQAPITKKEIAALRTRAKEILSIIGE